MEVEQSHMYINESFYGIAGETQIWPTEPTKMLNSQMNWCISSISGSRLKQSAFVIEMKTSFVDQSWTLNQI